MALPSILALSKENKIDIIGPHWCEQLFPNQKTHRPGKTLKNKEGIILLGIFLVSLPLTCIIIGAFTMYIPGIIGLIEGIIYLTKSDEEFYNTYQVGKKPWF